MLARAIGWCDVVVALAAGLLALFYAASFGAALAGVALALAVESLLLARWLTGVRRRALLVAATVPRILVFGAWAAVATAPLLAVLALPPALSLAALWSRQGLRQD